jgi:hypothetical protein
MASPASVLLVHAVLVTLTDSKQTVEIPTHFAPAIHIGCHPFTRVVPSLLAWGYQYVIDLPKKLDSVLGDRLYDFLDPEQM